MSRSNVTQFAYRFKLSNKGSVSSLTSIIYPKDIYDPIRVFSISILTNS